MSKGRRSIVFGPLPPPYGGVSVFMSGLYNFVPRATVDVWAYSGSEASKSFPEARYVNHRRLGHIAALTASGRGTRVIDSSHFHLEYPHRILLPAWLKARSVLGFQWIKILHDGSLPFRYQDFTAKQKGLFAAGLGKVDEMIVVTPDLQDFCRQHMDSAQISCIPSLLPMSGGWIDAPTASRWSAAIDRHRQYGKRVCSLGAFIPSYGFHGRWHGHCTRFDET